MLTTGDQQVVEAARSERNQGRATDMNWLLHDRLGFNYRMSDVTAALGVAQTRQVLNLVRRLAERDLGVAIVTHNLHDVVEVADRITVLRLGQLDHVPGMEAAAEGDAPVKAGAEVEA